MPGPPPNFSERSVANTLLQVQKITENYNFFQSQFMTSDNDGEVAND